MKLNVRTAENGTKEHIGLRLYAATVVEIDAIAEKLNVKRSVIIRHALNNFLDEQEEA